jgi:hypothetical protein
VYPESGPGEKFSLEPQLVDVSFWSTLGKYLTQVLTLTQTRGKMILLLPIETSICCKVFTPSLRLRLWNFAHDATRSGLGWDLTKTLFVQVVKRPTLRGKKLNHFYSQTTITLILDLYILDLSLLLRSKRCSLTEYTATLRSS